MHPVQSLPVSSLTAYCIHRERVPRKAGQPIIRKVQTTAHTSSSPTLCPATLRKRATTMSLESFTWYCLYSYLVGHPCTAWGTLAPSQPHHRSKIPSQPDQQPQLPSQPHLPSHTSNLNLGSQRTPHHTHTRIQVTLTVAWPMSILC